MRKILIALISLMCGYGCYKPVIVGDDLHFECRVRPVVITKMGTSKWNNQLLKDRIDVVNPIFSQTKIKFTFLDIEYLERPDIYECRDAGFIEICKLSKEKAEKKGELGVYFVYDIIIKEFEAGGIANLPSNLYGSIYQHGLAIAIASYKDVIAHELGHAFNLLHPWEDDYMITDTPSSNPCDCDIIEKYCNIMSYCGDEPLLEACVGKNLSPQQVKTVRNWAAFYPRSLVVTSYVFTPSTVPIYTTNIKPVFSMSRKQ